LELRPDYGQAHNNLGNALLMSGRLAEAAPHYEQALRWLPDFHTIRYNFGNCLLGLGRMEEAAVQYRKGIALNPDFANLHCNLAVILYRQNKISEAIQEYRRAIEADPKLADAHGNLGELLRQAGHVEAACQEYERALALDPDLRTALLNLAWIHATHSEARMRDGARAVGLARHAVDLGGQQDIMALRVLAAALAENGQFDEAEATARKALTLATRPDQEFLANALRPEILHYQSRLPVRQ
jgi:tetratricopeptide (TPR) repeat protein